MLGAGVDLELAAQLLLGERGLGQHAEDGLLDDAVRVLGEQVARGREALVAHVAGVREVLLLVSLRPGELDLGGVDHDDEVAAVHVRREGRLVLAADELGHGAGQPAERHAGGVDHMPVVADVVRRGGKGLHGPLTLGVR